MLTLVAYTMDDQDEIKELEGLAIRVLERQIDTMKIRKIEEYVSDCYKDALLFIKVLHQMRQEGM